MLTCRREGCAPQLRMIERSAGHAGRTGPGSSVRIAATAATIEVQACTTGGSVNEVEVDNRDTPGPPTTGGPSPYSPFFFLGAPLALAFSLAVGLASGASLGEPG